MIFHNNTIFSKLSPVKSSTYELFPKSSNHIRNISSKQTYNDPKKNLNSLEIKKPLLKTPSLKSLQKTAVKVFP